ncbi:MAG: hypothetical protein GQ546_09235 [Gammaproteobacteria bacterium]|nr:hypothetical protein [Gammaproteobacteria bacterium]
MKIIILVAVLLLSACSIQPTDSSLELKQILAYGDVIELNSLNKNIDKDLYLRLYRIPYHGEDCFIETHGICKYSYYISVSSFDEYPDINLYKLRSKGEITNINWKKEYKFDYAEIEVDIQNYTIESLKNNSSLSKEKHELLLKISPVIFIEKSKSNVGQPSIETKK